MTTTGNKNVSTRRGGLSSGDYASRLVDIINGGDDFREGVVPGEATIVSHRGELLPLPPVADARVIDSKTSDQRRGIISGTISDRRLLFRKDSDAGFGLLSLVLGAVSLVMFYVDIASDIWLVYNYFKTGHNYLAIATLSIVVLSSLACAAFGLHWYWVDLESSRKVQAELHHKHDRSDIARAIALPRRLWLARFLFTALQMGTVFRTAECLYYGWRSCGRVLCCRSKDGLSQRRLYGLWYQYEEADLSLLRLLEAFLEAAPQLVFQLLVWIWLQPQGDVVWTSLRVLGLLSSWINLAQAIQSFHAAQRFSTNRRQLSLLASVLYVAWRACEVATRVVTLALFTLTFYGYVIIPVALHFLIVFGWLMCQNIRVYRNNVQNTFFMVFAAYIMVFCFLNLRDGFSRWRYMLYYLLFYSTNAALFAASWAMADATTSWILPWAMYALLVLFCLHMTFLVLYYTSCHPGDGVHLWVSFRDTFTESVWRKPPKSQDDQRMSPERLEENRKIYIVASAIREKTAAATVA